MAIAHVKGHQRKTNQGKVVTIAGHDRYNTTHTNANKKKITTRGTVKKLFYDVVKSTKWAKELAERYKDYPMNAKLMTNSRWKNTSVTKQKTDRKGERVPYTTTKRIVSWKESEWGKFLKENQGLLHYVINKHFSFKSDLRDDLAAEGNRALFEAANTYESKYNPENPADWTRHAMSYVRGFMQSELNRQMATHLSMPYQKQRLYGKFKELWYRHNGDWSKIHKEMGLTKKDLYPSIDKEQANDPLPQEGYLTVMRGESLQSKTDLYENNVNKINDRYNTSMATLKIRREDGGTYEDYKGALSSYDDQIKRYSSAQKKASSVKDKDEFASKIKDIEQSKKLYETTFKPISTDEEYEREKKVIETIRQSELRDAKAKFDKEVDKTTLTGTNELFRQFEALMDFREVNLSGGVVGNEGQYTSTEEITLPEEYREPNQLGEMIIAASFQSTVEKFLNDVNQLDNRTSTLLKLRLGLHENNELYAHGLWGKPMTVPEIADAIDAKMYEQHDTRGGTHREKVKSWNSRKPEPTEKVKKSDAKYNTELKAYNSRKSKYQKDMKKMQNTTKWKGYTQEAKSKIRAQYQKEMKARVEDAPQKFTEKKLSAAAYNKALKNWKAVKPVREHKREVLVKRIRRDVELGTMALRRIADPKNVQSMLQAYRTMRSSGLARPEIKRELMKSLIFDTTLGVVYCTPEKLDLIKAEAISDISYELNLERERKTERDGEGLVQKVKDASNSFLNKWFGENGIFTNVMKQD